MKQSGAKLNNSFLAFGLVIGLLLAVCSCSSPVKPAEDSGFIPNAQRQIKRYDLPFQKAWVKKDFDKRDYAEIIVAPVNTSYLAEMSWWDQTHFRGSDRAIEEDIRELARYTQSSFTKAFEEAEVKRFDIVERPTPGKKTLRLELAIIEVVPSKVVLRTLGIAAQPLKMVYGANKLVEASERTVAFEARVRDVQTQEIVATFADRERADVLPEKIANLSWYGPARDVIDEWAEQVVQVANKTPWDKVTDDDSTSSMAW